MHFFQNDFVCLLLAPPAEAAPGKYFVTFLFINIQTLRYNVHDALGLQRNECS